MRVASIALILAACGADPTEPDAEACRDGFTRADDGHCYPPLTEATPVVTDLLLEAPCARAAAGDALQLEIGCIEGACAGDTFATVDAAFGYGARCDLLASGLNWSCEWPQGVQAQFPAAEVDSGEPGDAVKNNFVRALTRYLGTSPDGLGLTVAPSCFVETYGPPSSVIYVESEEGLGAVQLVWDEYGLEIEDEERATDDLPFPDDQVDEITLFGP